LRTGKVRCGEEQGDGGKEGGERGEQALANSLVAEQIELRGDVRDAKAVVGCAMNWRRESARASGFWPSV